MEKLPIFIYNASIIFMTKLDKGNMGKKLQTNLTLIAQLVKNLPAMWETWVQSLGWEDLLEEGVATLSSILAWRTPWTEESGGLQSRGSQTVRHN